MLLETKKASKKRFFLKTSFVFLFTSMGGAAVPCPFTTGAVLPD